MRFHVVSLPHTQTTAAYATCAYTQKVVRFCAMMKGLGHEVVLYAGEKNEAPCDELVTCATEAEQREALAGRHYVHFPFDGGPLWQKFNAAALAAMGSRLGQKDFICLIGGLAQRSIADAFPAHMSVEFGIGYAGTFAKYRVFESYAWMHMVYGRECGDLNAKDGGWFDAVIPNQVDPALFPYRGKDRRENDYYLYVGRLIDRKGYRTAQDVCQRLGKRLLLAGPGLPQGYGEFVGEVGAEERGRLMSGARALFAPTQYVEPFGTVTIEAMACGTPVICTDWGAFTETVEQGVDGFRCRNLAEFCTASEAVKELDPRIIRRRALKRFSVKSVAAQYDAYFDRLSALWGDGWYAAA